MQRSFVSFASVSPIPIFSIAPRSSLLRTRIPTTVRILKTRYHSISRRFGVTCSLGVESGVLTDSATPIVQSIASLVPSITVFIGLVLLGQQLLAPEQNQGIENRDVCPRCHGTGFEPCLCTRWSDGDVGCPSCHQTGWMKCKACGGGGKAVPLSVYITNEDSTTNSQRY